jgi:hypothetical protein
MQRFIHKLDVKKISSFDVGSLQLKINSTNFKGQNSW